MYTLIKVEADHPLYVTPPTDSVEHVYSAIEYETSDPSTARSIVCYRTKDGLTHLAEAKDGNYSVRASVSPHRK